MAATTRRALLTGAAALAMAGAATAAVPSDWDRLIATAQAHGDPVVMAFLLEARQSGASVDQVVTAVRRQRGWNRVQDAYLPDHEDWPAILKTAERHGFEPDEATGAYTTWHGPEAGRLSLVVMRSATGEESRITRDGRVR